MYLLIVVISNFKPGIWRLIVILPNDSFALSLFEDKRDFYLVKNKFL